MIGLEIRFLTGRFHANGWQHAHNEGIPEWPPSPWRVLRALVNAAYLEHIARDDVAPLLEKLRVLPRYRLPAAVDAHTRHYMPDVEDAQHKRAKIFDAFVVIDGGAARAGPLTIAWPTVLTDPERELLARLCKRVGYLGRAESWAELKVVEVHGDVWDAWPDDGGSGHGTSLMAVTSADELAAWAAQHVAPKKGLDVPRSLWDVLVFDGARYRREGWSAVPGTRLVRYAFAREPFQRAVVPAHRMTSARPTIARFAIRSPVLPSLREALALGERLRTAMMSQSKHVSGDARPVFSGHSSVASEHQHAMYLSSCDELEHAGRRVVDHLTVSAKLGFEEQDIIALQRLRRIWGRGGHDLELVLVGLGHPSDFGGLEQPSTRVLAKHHAWESITPFIPTRHPKRVRGEMVDSIEDQIRRGCKQLLGRAPIVVEPFGLRADWARFRRRRKLGGGSRGPDVAVGARIVFDEPVSGPIALGYGAHYGLGLFAASDVR